MFTQLDTRTVCISASMQLLYALGTLKPSCAPLVQIQALWQTGGLVSVALASSMR